MNFTAPILGGAIKAVWLTLLLLGIDENSFLLIYT